MTNNNDDDIKVNVNLEYELQLTKKTLPDYTMTQKISEWLHDNLAGLKDDQEQVLFNKVNYGFNDDNLRNFGNRPTCDVYINQIEYDSNYDDSKPKQADSIILFYFKGANNNSYMNACELHDYIMQEFTSNEDFKILPGVVRDTIVQNSRIMNQQIRKQWGVMGAFELTHILF